MKSYTVAEAQVKLEHYCTYQERCHKEVNRKLIDMGMIQQARDKIIMELMQGGYLNEGRFAKTYVRGKFNTKKWGRYRLRGNLRKLDISKRNISEALSILDEEEYISVLESLSRKRLRQISSITDKYKKRKKLADYLLYRGWESHLVYDKVRELIP